LQLRYVTTLAEFLAALRARSRLKADDVADRLGASRAAVHFWEATSGVQRRPSPENLQALLDLYKVSTHERSRAFALYSGAADPGPDAEDPDLQPTESYDDTPRELLDEPSAA
jgi:transcriptional regulator with XRE-family HTH domain